MDGSTVRLPFRQEQNCCGIGPLSCKKAFSLSSSSESSSAFSSAFAVSLELPAFPQRPRFCSGSVSLLSPSSSLFCFSSICMPSDPPGSCSGCWPMASCSQAVAFGGNCITDSCTCNNKLETSGARLQPRAEEPRGERCRPSSSHRSLLRAQGIKLPVSTNVARPLVAFALISKSALTVLWYLPKDFSTQANLLGGMASAMVRKATSWQISCSFWMLSAMSSAPSKFARSFVPAIISAR
mmetsp:Transcript_15406/g.30353  ORF Transcript_15406/g.30353 Transcript_15406/m.30353 type:complete len:239 (+) Transcript_15406:300-1016(+)